MQTDRAESREMNLFRRFIVWYLAKIGFVAVDKNQVQDMERQLHALRKTQPDCSYFGREAIQALSK